MINTMRQQSNKIAFLEKENEERKAKEAKKGESDESSTAGMLGNRLMLTAGPSAASPTPFANGIAPQTTGYRGF